MAVGDYPVLDGAGNVIIPAGRGDGPSSQRGDWEPSLTFSTPGNLDVAYTTRLGEWFMHDGWATLFFAIMASTFTHTTASGNLRIAGSPFVAKTRTGMVWAGCLDQLTGITKANYTHFGVAVVSGFSLIVPHANGSGQNTSGISAADMPSGTDKTLIGSVTFPVAGLS